MARARILYLALADARGHLMRAHLLSRALAPAGIEVQIVTTSESGRRFLGALGTESRRLCRHFQVEFGPRHDMAQGRTDRRILAYLGLPWRVGGDLGRLLRWSRGADFVVNDSLHPALLPAPALSAPLRVVQVYGENLWGAMEANFDGRASRLVCDGYRSALRHARDRSFARIVHVLGADGGTRVAASTWHLPPLVARPDEARAAVRSRLGCPEGRPLAAVYVNPHFTDAALADALEAALRTAGFHVHAVGEGYAGRRSGWIATDGRFSDAVHAADLFVSGAGMGALELARNSGTPLLVLLGRQPEQRLNVERLARFGAAEIRSVDLSASEDPTDQTAPQRLNCSRARAGRDSPRTGPSAPGSRLSAISWSVPAPPRRRPHAGSRRDDGHTRSPSGPEV